MGSSSLSDIAVEWIRSTEETVAVLDVLLMRSLTHGGVDEVCVIFGGVLNAPCHDHLVQGMLKSLGQLTPDSTSTSS